MLVTNRKLKDAILWLVYHAPSIPIPWRLPYGNWAFLYPDEMGVNLVQRLWCASRGYEEREWRLVSKIVTGGMTCFDIGANQGFYTILLSNLVGEKGNVYAFEPNEQEQRKARRNVSLNRGENVIFEHKAVGAFNGDTELICCQNGRGSRSSLRAPPNEVVARTIVKNIVITTLDSYVATLDITSIGFIKVDIEGGERDVLLGARAILERYRPVIMLELADVTTRQFGYAAYDNVQHLINFEYLVFEIDSAGYLAPLQIKESYRENIFGIPAEMAVHFSSLIA